MVNDDKYFSNLIVGQNLLIDEARCIYVSSSSLRITIIGGKSEIVLKCVEYY